MSLLLDEYPLLILPKLACLVGLNEAIVLQQVHYWCQHYRNKNKLRHYHDGRWWVYNAIDSQKKDAIDWQDNFPFWSASTIKRTIRKLVKSGLLLQANYNLAGYDRTGWYTIDHNQLNELIEKARRAQPTPLGQNDPMDQVKMTQWIRSDCPNGSGQNDPMDQVNLTPPIPETTTDHPMKDIIWSQARDELKLQMTESAYYTWLIKASLSNLIKTEDQYQATILCLDHYTKDWLENRLNTPIQRTLAGLLQVDKEQLTITYDTKKGDS